MPKLTENVATDPTPGKKERFLGLLGRVPLVNRVVRRFSPTTMDPTARTELAFTISSKDASKIKDTEASIYREISNILAAPTASAETAKEQIDKFREDLPRFTKVNFTLGTTLFDESSIEFDEKRADMRRKNLEAFASNLLSEADLAKIDWLTKDHILLMLSYLDQRAAQDAIVALKENTRIMRRVANEDGSAQDVHLTTVIPIQTKQDRVLYTLSLSDMSVTMEYQQYLHFAADLDIDQDQLSKDLQVNVQLTIDFSKLSVNKDQVVLPNVDAVIEKVEMRAISPSIYFNVSNQILDLMNKRDRDYARSPESIDDRPFISPAPSTVSIATTPALEDEVEENIRLIIRSPTPVPTVKVSQPTEPIPDRGVISRGLFSALDKITKLPIINPALDYFFRPAAQTYTVSSAIISEEEYPQGDIKHYVAEMLYALYVNDDQTIDEVAAINSESLYEQFLGDLNRFDVVKVTHNGSTSVSAETTNAEQRFADRKRYVDGFLDRVAAQAQADGKAWVTRDKLHGILGYLNQGLIAEARNALEYNSAVTIARHIGEQPKKTPNLWPINSFGSYPLLAHLKTEPAITENLNIDNQKISLTYKLYLHSYELGPFGIDTTEVQRDLEVTITTSIDFAYLSATPGKMAANSDAVTQTITVQPLTRGVNFAFTGQIAELKKQEFLQAHTYTVDAPLPRIADAAGDASNEPGLWDAFKRRLYIPNFLSRQADMPDPNEESKPRTRPKIE